DREQRRGDDSEQNSRALAEQKRDRGGCGFYRRRYRDGSRATGAWLTRPSTSLRTRPSRKRAAFAIQPARFRQTEPRHRSIELFCQCGRRLPRVELETPEVTARDQRARRWCA